ncbi:hypothetical protein CDD83_11044 [Cordyceps sp. RAO-2017]|nr:hypothetical protein CDD83_11044 [Cordyceps sp. RAO-2017]
MYARAPLPPPPPLDRVSPDGGGLWRRRSLFRNAYTPPRGPASFVRLAASFGNLEVAGFFVSHPAAQPQRPHPLPQTSQALGQPQQPDV